MGQFFAKDWAGAPFQFMGATHLITLGIILLFIILLSRLKGAPEKTLRTVRIVLAAALWANEFGWHIWNAATGQWTIQTMLPLHLCSVLVWTSAIMLVTRNYQIYEIAYLMGIAGALQALLTPDLGIYGYPHFRFFQTFISHGLIVSAAIYMTTVEGLRPTWKSLPRVFLWVNGYTLVVFAINQLIGSNYLFVAHKPPTASLLDLLPDWPWYIIHMELIGLVFMLLFYAPFAVKDFLACRKSPSQPDQAAA